ncbi:HlyD family secretion protein [Leptolyngbya sp. PL-A3]|nr:MULTISPECIES: biotin/lipoyl-binding protein [unclassified Leptolyngbya]
MKQLLVKEGDRVQQCQIVAYMDDSNLQGQLTQTRAQLAQQEANLAKLFELRQRRKNSRFNVRWYCR